MKKDNNNVLIVDLWLYIFECLDIWFFNFGYYFYIKKLKNFNKTNIYEYNKIIIFDKLCSNNSPKKNILKNDY